MKLKDFTYDLPRELIAQEPLVERSESRLLVFDKRTGDIEHKKFNCILDYLEDGDCIVLNDTRVIPARLIGEKENTGGKIEFVLLNRKENDIWEVILRPGRKAKIGSRFLFGGGVLKAEIVDIIEDGNRLVNFEYEGIFEEVLDKVGIIPLPPYITHKLEDSERYQTVYSKENGSAAAPTAGLHFTDSILNDIKNKGVSIAKVTLHVGLGTFRPVKEENILDHKMHSEYYSICSDAVQKINKAKKENKRIISVGTTSTRVLETVADENGLVSEKSGWTDIFIYPGYNYKIVDSLITNFHLPESTLLMLISAFSDREKILNAYNKAIEEKYRFFSFGDAMFIK